MVDCLSGGGLVGEHAVEYALDHLGIVQLFGLEGLAEHLPKTCGLPDWAGCTVDDGPGKAARGLEEVPGEGARPALPG